jgi:ribonuclease D
MVSFQFIDRAEELSDVVTRQSGESAVALDTEFMRDRTFFPKLCLVQLASARGVFCIDPLAIRDLAPLELLFADKACRKIVHAARQDVEVLLTRCRELPVNVFDTQVAAALLGMPPQIGYGDLVKRELGVELEKAHARTDWTVRPLSAEQLEYAAEDVCHLPPLAAALARDLAQRGRIAWFEYEMQRITDPLLYRAHPEEAWRRLKGLDSLDPRRQEVAKALARWREERAMRRDLPRGWILADEALNELVRVLPVDRDALARVRTLPRGVFQKSGDDLIATIAASAHLGSEPERRRERPDPERERQLKTLSAIVRRVAADVGLSPEILATRRDLQNLLNGRRDIEPLRNWRREVVGDALLAAV